MKEYKLHTSELKQWCEKLKAGDRVILSGTVYTSRDAAHKRIFELLENNGKLPYALENAVIYYAGPTPTPDNLAIGSCGPTTSVRMDPYTPKLLDLGVAATIGKGERSQEVVDAIIRNKSVYLCAIGGAGALASLSIKECEVVGFDELGCESAKRLTFENFPLIVGIDCSGGSLFKR